MAFQDLNERSLKIFKELVDAFLETGEPIGSRTISRRLPASLSPATIRNVMADLEEAGLLYAPHTSAGRLPTDAGLQFFVHGLLEFGDLTEFDCLELEKTCQASGKDINSLLDQATTMLSGLSNCAGLVLAPKVESPLKQIEFVHLGENRALAILITEDGLVENRLFELHQGLQPFALQEASNYLTAKLSGKTLQQAQFVMQQELKEHQELLNSLTSDVIEQGLAVWSGDDASSRRLIVKGQSRLLQNVTMLEEVEQVRQLFNILESKEKFASLLDSAIQAEGVQIFIGAENALFKLSGCSLIVSPYKNSKQEILGAIGVLGPSRMNYGRIIPLVDYSAKIISKLLGNR
jgi:heat-inducible transcriptional repressor